MGLSRSCYSLRDQLKVNQDFADTKNVTFADVERVIKKVRSEWGIASICDIVLNHTANESEWLIKHPDSTYSCFTMPHLRPAFLLDVVFAIVTRDTADGKLETVGVPKLVENEDHIQALRHQLHTVYLPKASLYQLYQCDVEAYVTKFNENVSFWKQEFHRSKCLQFFHF